MASNASKLPLANITDEDMLDFTFIVKGVPTKWYVWLNQEGEFLCKESSSRTWDLAIPLICNKEIKIEFRRRMAECIVSIAGPDGLAGMHDSGYLPEESMEVIYYAAKRCGIQ